MIIFEIFCVFLIFGLIGYTYSFFSVEATDNSTITGQAASLSLSLRVNKVAPSIDKPLIPQLDSAITSAVVGRNNSNCVDDNGNAVCQVYEIIVKNTSDATIFVDGLLYLTVGENTNLKWTIIDDYEIGISNNPSLITPVNNQTSKTITAYEKYEINDEKKYYIVIWISETGSSQTDSGSFSEVVTFKSSEFLNPAVTTLYSLGIAPNIDVPTFEKTSCSIGCDENTVGVYSALDDLGTSYYFRGDVENNYVYFAEKYWRIIRINGDGTIRMIYDGNSAYPNGTVTTDKLVAKMAFKTSPYNDNTYVGYMYGTPGVTGTGDEAYYTTHSNLYDSNIKNYLENTWHPTFSDANKSKIANAIYCNDRSIDTYFDYFTGIGTDDTCYGAYGRVFRYQDTAVNPILTCPLANDRFTYQTTNIGDVETNGKLNAPVGLITADELAFAGTKRANDNPNSYLYCGKIYWTMSSAYFVSTGATMFATQTGGWPNGFGVYGSNFWVRPVISLLANSISSGNGTISNPFIVS